MITIKKSNSVIKVSVPLTPSKSITNRLLIIRSLCREQFSILNSATAIDCVILDKILSYSDESLDCGDSGTAFRFLTAYLSVNSGVYILTGSERMKSRPIGPLVEALKSMGADISYLEKVGYPPLKIIGKKIVGGNVCIDASQSSQYISALLLIAPMLEGGLKIELTGKINSRPYIIMTLSLMHLFGISFKTEGNFITISEGKYTSCNITVENDWSSASFWYLIAALSDESTIELKGLCRNSIQGDSIIASIMTRFGIQTEFIEEGIVITRHPDSLMPISFEYDFSSCPDLVIPVAVLCATKGIVAELKGVKNLRIKESDRLEALKQELAKTGAEIEIQDDSFFIRAGKSERTVIDFHSHNDHRIVMSLAPLALMYDYITIDEHIPVNKSYPDFWKHFSSAEFDCAVT